MKSIVHEKYLELGVLEIVESAAISCKQNARLAD